MNFTLYYRGLLKSNGSSKEKHELRKIFHPQIKVLWNQEPLIRFASFYNNTKPECSIAQQVGNFTFVPLVCEGLGLVAHIHITLLRPERPGSIVTQGGDIDNRLKTLFDSFRIPTERELPDNIIPDSDENPFYCLLEDDNLITEISVSTKQLLIPVENKGEVITIIDIDTITIDSLMGGMEITQ